MVDYFGAIVVAKKSGNLLRVGSFDNLYISSIVVTYATAEPHALRVVYINYVAPLAFAFNTLDTGCQQAAFLLPERQGGSGIDNQLAPDAEAAEHPPLPAFQL